MAFTVRALALAALLALLGSAVPARACDCSDVDSAIAPDGVCAHRCALEVLQARGDHAAFLAALTRAAESLRSLGVEAAVAALLPYPERYVERKQLEQASDAYLALLEVYPDSAKLHAGHGVALLSEGDLEAASARFARAFELDPGDLLVLGHSASAALYRRDFAEARRFYELALRVEPGATSRYFDLAAIALEKGAASAIPAWRRYLDQHAQRPDDDPWPQIAEVILARLEGARSSGALDEIAQGLIGAGAPAQAIPALVGAAQREPGEPVHLFLLARAYGRGGFPAQALDELLRVQRLVEDDPLLETPSRASVAYEVGRVALGLRRLDLAQQNLERAAREDPTRADTHYALGLTYQRFGRSDLAHEAFGRCLWAERPSSDRELCRKGAIETAPASATPGE